MRPALLLMMACAVTCASAAGAERASPASPRSYTVRLLPGEPQALFVKDGAIMSPLARVAAGRIEPFTPAQDYFAAGRAYYLYSAGSAGKAMVTGEKDVGCGRRAGAVQAVIGPDANGVLSNFPLGQRQAAARAPTAAEQQLIAQIARQLLRRQNIPPHYIARMLGKSSQGVQRQESLAALPLSGNPEPLLFASYTLDWALDNRRGSLALSFIAEPNETGIYLVTWRDFDQTEGESGGNTRKFLANADLNGDGSEELVLSATGNERWWYEVLSRVGGKWTVAASSPAGGC
jgi:hypothetical protein